MPLPLLPLAVVGLAAMAVRAKGKRDASLAGQIHGVMTPERQHVYDNAMNNCRDPNSLVNIAGEFEKQGLPAHADMLRKRARLRALPPEVKEARKQAYKKAMGSKDRQGVMKIAAAFHGEGACGAAENLYKYAMGLPLSQGAADINPES